MKHPNDFEFDDLQALVRFGHGKLTDTCFLLLNIEDAAAAKQWLKSAPVSNATETDTPPEAALQIAFSVCGLRKMGLDETVIGHFSPEFQEGMSGNHSRSRRLGDVESNAPEQWLWGYGAEGVPHVLLLLYALPGGIEHWRKVVQGDRFSQAFKVFKVLPTQDIGAIEPFGFADGISQPKMDWHGQQSTDPHDRDGYSNLLAAGEVLLGYPNEYRQYSPRPLINPSTDPFAAVLPAAAESPALKDLGRNGTYLVLRQLSQDVAGFWAFVDHAVGHNPQQREQFAAAMVGRRRDGSPLLIADEEIAGVGEDEPDNRFTYKDDPNGQQCPLGAHIRRTNPRTGDLPPGISGFFSRLKKILGFGLSYPAEDLVAASRFHRLLRRGRSYGPLLTPEAALKPEAPNADGHGLQFICLVANISRQFEFVQNAWAMNSKFGAVQQESDPLLGSRQPLRAGESTDQFNRPDKSGPVQKTCPLPQFVSVRGGGYFFMPGLRALKYIAARPGKGSGSTS